MLPSIPLKPQPRNVLSNGVHVFRVFLDRVGVVKPEIDHAPILRGQPKVHTNRLGVPNVQIAIGFWRKPCVHTTTVQPCFKVGIHDLLNEMTAAVAFFIPLSGRMRCG